MKVKEHLPLSHYSIRAWSHADLLYSKVEEEGTVIITKIVFKTHTVQEVQALMLSLFIVLCDYNLFVLYPI